MEHMTHTPVTLCRNSVSEVLLQERSVSINATPYMIPESTTVLFNRIRENESNLPVMRIRSPKKEPRKSVPVATLSKSPPLQRKNIGKISSLPRIGRRSCSVVNLTESDQDLLKGHHSSYALNLQFVDDTNPNAKTSNTAITESMGEY